MGCRYETGLYAGSWNCFNVFVRVSAGGSIHHQEPYYISFNVSLTRQIRHLTCITFQLRQGALY